MNKFVIVSFGIMGWAFWELSGGADFEPKSQRIVESAHTEPAIASTAMETSATVTKNESIVRVVTSVPTVRATPAVVRTANTASVIPAVQPGITNNVFATSRNVNLASYETPNAAFVPAVAEATPVPAAEPAPRATADMRQVRGSRVNMRGGPGIGYGVLAVLSRGQEVQILRESGSGWLKLRDQESGIVGWMSAKMITSPNS
ncbi:SH3 domain-containing protein [Shimia sp. R9_2]|uniref:SH3 domain-containing protein n=1 Tax=Shimia sp. R9_2 TaxID=2821112 RepID=UPI001ADC3384|nr:SH3 domain-containing protein [Shimia sp. R9_2]